MGIFAAFKEGGPFMYFILAFGVLTFSVLVERGINLFLRIKSPNADFRSQVLNYISRGDFRGAENFARSSKPTSLGRVVAVGCHIRAGAGGDEELQARMDEQLSHEIAHIDKRTNFLSVFGNVATLLGLLGTITGMIHSFAAVASANPADRAVMLSKGISEAMNCTAFGLIVAIPALVAYAFYQNKTDQLVTDLTDSTTQIYHDLIFHSESEAHSFKVADGRVETRAKGSASPSLSV